VHISRTDLGKGRHQRTTKNGGEEKGGEPFTLGQAKERNMRCEVK